MEIENIAMIGAGAIGSVYGKLLHDQYGEKFFLIAGGARREKLQNQGISLNSAVYRPKVEDPAASKKRVQLLLVCVKNYQLDEAIRDMKNFVTASTAILPLLNGVTATQRLHEAFPQAHVLYGVSVGIDAVRNETGVTNTNNGFIQFGDEKNKMESMVVGAVKDCLLCAGIRAQVFEDMMQILWRKWMLNVGFNQVSALTRADYGKMIAVPELWSAVKAAMREVLAIAQKLQINVSEADIAEIKKIIPTMNANGKTSMLQDVEAKRKTEVDYFSGTVIAYGKRLDIFCPVNITLYNLLKGTEEAYRSSASKPPF